MSPITHSAVPAVSGRRPARKPNLFVRFVHAVVESRTRMYLEAVTDPNTGRVDPQLERHVLRLMTL